MAGPDDRSGDGSPQSGGDGGGGDQSEGARALRSRYSAIVGLVFVVLVVVAAVNMLGSDRRAVLGADDRDRGWPLAQFAVPEALGPLEGDANVAQDDCETAENPCPPARRREPACEIGFEGAVQVCDLFDRPLAISFWFTRGGDCLPSQDAFDRVAARYEGEVNFLSINLLDNRDRVREVIRARGWSVPVGHDADGAVGSLFRIGVCPTIVLAYPGGIMHRAEIKPGNYEATEIDEMITDLLRASRDRDAGSGGSTERRVGADRE